MTARERIDYLVDAKAPHEIEDLRPMEVRRRRGLSFCWGGSASVAERWCVIVAIDVFG